MMYTYGVQLSEVFTCLGIDEQLTWHRFIVLRRIYTYLLERGFYSWEFSFSYWPTPSLDRRQKPH